MALSYDDWKRADGWDASPPPNPWNFRTPHNLKFGGAGTNASPGTLSNTTRGATEGDTCIWSSISTSQDQVSVRCIRNSKTYIITRTVTAGVSALSCNGGTSGGSSWTAIEGG